MKITKFNPTSNNNIVKFRKENNFDSEHVLITLKGESILTIRLYKTYSTTFACVWGNSDSHDFYGGGKGQDTEDAVRAAMEAVGIHFKIDSCYSYDIEPLMRKIAAKFKRKHGNRYGKLIFHKANA